MFQPMLEMLETNCMEHFVNKVSCFYKIPRFELMEKYTEKEITIMMGDIVYYYDKQKEEVEEDG